MNSIDATFDEPTPRRRGYGGKENQRTHTPAWHGAVDGLGSGAKRAVGAVRG